jgi:hypothetical protein
MEVDKDTGGYILSRSTMSAIETDWICPECAEINDPFGWSCAKCGYTCKTRVVHSITTTLISKR